MGPDDQPYRSVCCRSEHFLLLTMARGIVRQDGNYPRLRIRILMAINAGGSEKAVKS